MKTSVTKQNTAHDISQKAEAFLLLGEDTRLKIMCFMFERKHACVSEIADALGFSVANISYHLQLLKKGGFFETHRMGNEICYKLVESNLIKKLRGFICD